MYLELYIIEGIFILAAYVAAVRLAELLLAERNRRITFSLGGVEFGARHYPAFFFLHAFWFFCWVAESLFRGRLDHGWQFWLALFFLAQLLKLWSMVSLGENWNTRIIVVPGRLPVRRGPYRFLRHPNYLAVIIELFAVPMVFGAWVTALSFSILNAALLFVVRMPIEEEALAIFNEDIR